MSSAIEVLKEIIKGEGFDYNITKEYVIALKEALLALEKQEQYEKSIDSILNLANTIIDDSTDGNTIIRTLCDSGLELEQGKDYNWKRKGSEKINGFI